jgi:hypothetical protein
MICVVDTSVLGELLRVPGRMGASREVETHLESKVENRETLVLPLVVLFETGNHIGNVKDGTGRRSAAERFVELGARALANETPFRLAPAPSPADIARLLGSFTDWATQGSGLGDLSIKDIWEAQCALHRHRRVYIWSLDAHLASFDRAPP